MSGSRTSSAARAALIAALVGAGALIALPVGPVPITLQTLVVAVAALVLTPAEAFLALALYVAVGAVGAPVFSGGNGGIGVLLGPTGGFLAGFVLGAGSGALVRRAIARPKHRFRALVGDVAALLVLLSATYLLGWAWFATVTGRDAAEAFMVAVAPFVLVDAVKCAVALPVARALRSAGFARS